MTDHVVPPARGLRMLRNAAIVAACALFLVWCGVAWFVRGEGIVPFGVALAFAFSPASFYALFRFYEHHATRPPADGPGTASPAEAGVAA